MTLLDRYAALLRGTGAGPAMAASLLARLALGTTGLALLLLVRVGTGSYASAGAVAAAFAVSLAVFAPVRARSADRRGPVPVLAACALLHPLALGGVVLLSRAGAGVLLLAAGAVVSGATVPPVGGVMRALWGSLAEADARLDVTAAYSLESVAVELSFLTGPLVVAGLTTTLGAASAVLASGLLVLLGGLGMVATGAVRRVVPHPGADRAAGGPLRSAAVRRLLATVLFAGVGFGATDVAVLAFAEHAGTRPSGGAVLLAVWSAGSIAGGVTYGARSWRTPHDRQLRVLVAALALGSVLPLLAPGVLVMGVLLMLYGSTIAPYSTCNAVLLHRAAPPGTVTEAFAWSGSAIFAGAAAGNLLSGLAVEHVGVRAALGVTGAAGVAALLVTLAGGRRRSPSRPGG